MKLEHCGRYLWAAELLQTKGCKFIADIACANGYGTEILAEKIDRVIGIDRNEDYLSLAKRTVNCDRVSFLCCDLNQSKLPKSLQNVEAITCFETLEHVINPQAVLKEFFRVLCTSGILLLSVPNQKYEQLDENGNNKDSFHLHIFTQDETLELLAKTGFEVCEILGQDICNRVVSRIIESNKARIIRQEKKPWAYDKDTIRTMSYLLGYPDSKLVDESYSYIYVCKKCK